MGHVRFDWSTENVGKRPNMRGRHHVRQREVTKEGEENLRDQQDFRIVVWQAKMTLDEILIDTPFSVLRPKG